MSAEIDYGPLAKTYTFMEAWRIARGNTSLDQDHFALMTILDRSKTGATFLFNIFLIVNPIIAGCVWLMLLVCITVLTNGTKDSLLLIAWITLYPLFSLSIIIKNIKPFLRYVDFAKTNKITLLEMASRSDIGMIFKPDETQRFAPGFQFADQAKTAFGNLEWQSSSGKTQSQGFLRVELSRKLPHTIFDSTNNNLVASISNLPVNLKKRQSLSLEGNFDKYFTLYCPENYEQDTLYWLTPELMELLVTNLSIYDIEVVDNKVYLYPNGKFKLDEINIKKLISIADWLYYQFEDNTHRYADTRIASFAKNIVAAPGKRLRTRISPRTIILTALLALTMLWIFYY